MQLDGMAVKQRMPIPELCRRCAQINLHDVLHRAKISTSATSFLVGYTPRAWQVSGCSLCMIMRSMMPDEDRIAFTQIRGALASTYLSLKNADNSPIALAISHNVEGAQDHDVKIPLRGLIVAEIGSLRQEEPEPTLRGGRVNQDQVDYVQLRSWLENCDTLHITTCKRMENLDLLSIPLKCIDCYTCDVVEVHRNETYFALSYVWGGAVCKVTDQNTNKISFGTCQVVEDAIDLIKRLGMRYLWVDQFCIDQHDHEAKSIQIREMKQIYAGAYATIVAAAGEDANYGLAGVSRSRSQEQPHTQIGDFNIYSSMPRLAYAIKETIWNTRGWTYQEAVLSHRCIFFTEYQAYFVCQSSTRCESMHVHESNEIQITKTPGRRGSIARAIFQAEPQSIIKSPIEDLVNHIAEYSSRNLKFEADSLDAFRGLLSRSSLYTFYGIPVAINAGVLMPQTSELDLGFAKGLCWVRGPLTSSYRRKNGLQRRPQFPSWSWAGWKGCVAYHPATFSKGSKLPQKLTESGEHAKTSRFWLADEKGQLHTFEQVVMSLPRSTIIPELAYALVIETEVFSFSFQRGIDDRICWCSCHPHGNHPGRMPLWNSPWVAARPDFFERPCEESALYHRILNEKWDCLILLENEREEYRGQSFIVRDLMIVDWVGDFACRIGNLSIACLYGQEEWHRLWRKVTLR